MRAVALLGLLLSCGGALPADIPPAAYSGEWWMRLGSPRAVVLCEGRVVLPQGLWTCGAWGGQARVEGGRLYLHSGNDTAAGEVVLTGDLLAGFLDGFGLIEVRFLAQRQTAGM